MTILVSGTAASVATAGMLSGAVAGTTAGAVIALSGKMIGTGVAKGVAGAIGTSASAGAVYGTLAGGGVPSAVVGAAAAVISSALAAATQAVLSGPVGWLVVGATQGSSGRCSATYTFDCWKPVLHDESPEPSSGRLLRDVAADPRIKQVITSDCEARDSSLPEIVLENIWNERFRIEYIELSSGELAAHAVRLT